MLRPSVARALPALAGLVAATGLAAQGAPSRPTVEQFLNIPSPLQMTVAEKADRIAWTVYDRGMRNVYTAAAPSFTPVRLTRFLEDNGVDIGSVRLSDDGSIAVFVRGSAPNRAGWIANPSHDPAGGEQAIWAVRTTGGGPAWRVAVGSAPELSPDGRWVLFVKDGQIYRARVTRTGPATAMDTGGVPFIKEWGRQSAPQWSPDGSKVAFVSDRDNHAFIGLYDTRTHTVDYVAPSVDCDGSPTWSPDGKRIAFVRRPGVPFGMQSQEGSGGIGNPAGPAAGRAGSGCGFGRGFGGGGGRNAQPDSAGGYMRRVPGLYRSTFPGGYTVSVMVADVSNCKGHIAACDSARELWHNAPNDRVFTNVAGLQWAGADHVIFPLSPANDEWDRIYALSTTGPNMAPVNLTTTDGLIEGAGWYSLSRDGRTLYYSTNAKDIERRHLWAVPTAGGTPVQLTQGEGVEAMPMPLASGDKLAVLYYGVAQPASVAVVPAKGGEAKVIFPDLPKSFPVAEHVTPQIVITKAADGMEVHNQLFLPKDLKPGEKRPAIVFVHGGPIRQMLPAYHYMEFYHWAYGVNQWLASQGYVVLSINYRSGIGYGRSFRQAPNTEGRGNSEYQDVLAGGKYLQSRPDVDPARVGIWGLSYGGLLTAEALARNSDLFVAGVDMAGVHLYGNVLDTGNVAYRSSAVGAVDGWKSPVLIIQGDDDRNVDFAQSVGLVQLLRARNVYHELIIIPDDLHESMLNSRWMYTWNRMGDFLHRFLWEKQPAPTMVQTGMK